MDCLVAITRGYKDCMALTSDKYAYTENVLELLQVSSTYEDLVKDSAPTIQRKLTILHSDL